MDGAQSDLVLWYKLETVFFRDHVRHTRYAGKARNRNEKVKEDWSNCDELGRGGSVLFIGRWRKLRIAIAQ